MSYLAKVTLFLCKQYAHEIDNDNMDMAESMKHLFSFDNPLHINNFEGQEENTLIGSKD